MAVDTVVLVRVLDHAISHDMEDAIRKHGQTLSDAEKAQLRTLSKSQMQDILKNLVAADKQLNKMLFFDDNINNNK